MGEGAAARQGDRIEALPASGQADPQVVAHTDHRDLLANGRADAHKDLGAVRALLGPFTICASMAGGLPSRHDSSYERHADRPIKSNHLPTHGHAAAASLAGRISAAQQHRRCCFPQTNLDHVCPATASL